MPTTDQPRTRKPGCGTFTGLIVIVLPVFVGLAPNVEESQTEVRYQQVRIACREITQKLLLYEITRWPMKTPVQSISGDQVLVSMTDDPFGHAYRVVVGGTPAQLIRVFSVGPDGRSESRGLDPDDYCLNHPWSPLDQIRWERTRQWWIALGSWWGLVALCWVLIRKGESMRAGVP